MRAGLAVRLAALATALVIGPATFAPGTAEAPSDRSVAARANQTPTAAQQFGWGAALWDFAWEYGESLDSAPYRGKDIRGGRWAEQSDGTGRAVKTGGGVEFHSGGRYLGAPDFGTSTLTLQDKPIKRGRWEIKEKIRLKQYEPFDAPRGKRYSFVVELVPDDPSIDPCKAPAITVARAEVGGSSIQIGVDAGTSRWRKTFNHARTENDIRLYAVQVTGQRITWFLNGRVVASLAAAAAIPDVPMTLRMRLAGQGDTEMKKSWVMVDWVRGYDLARGKRTPGGDSLTKGVNPDC
jgi:hypothetical protein